MASIIIGVLAAALLLWAVLIYNRLVARKNHVLEAWSGIDVQLKRRHSLIPSLVEVVKAYGRYEQDVLKQVTAQRAGAGDGGNVAGRAAAESALSQSLRTLFAVAEAYPDLKANASYLDLQRNLTEIEEQIQYARRYYNGTVRELNILIQSFPSNLIAGPFGFKQADYFEIELATQREAPEVKL